MTPTIDPAAALAAWRARDRSADGRFVVAVSTTRIYCRPSCPARHPKPEHIRFYAAPGDAEGAGYRACLRCRPDGVARDEAAVATARAMLDHADDRAPSLAELAAATGYSAAQLQRIFTRAVGLSPAAYARSRRHARAEAALAEAPSVTDAIYAAGYAAPSRFYADSARRLGMTPSAWRAGGRGVTIRWAVVDSAFGPALIAATDRGICRLSFDEGEADLRQRFPNAELSPASLDDPIIAAAAAAIGDPARAADVPLDVAGTRFQEAVWAALRAIPPGETRSYAEIAAAVGRPAAVRAAGSANAANNVAVLIPCHRVVRSDGSAGGYAYGTERKQALLARERAGEG